MLEKLIGVLQFSKFFLNESARPRDLGKTIGKDRTFFFAFPRVFENFKINAHYHQCFATLHLKFLPRLHRDIFKVL